MKMWKNNKKEEDGWAEEPEDYDENPIKDKYKYVLVAGHRRYSACKALGHKTIAAYLKDTSKVIMLSLDEIGILDNTRIHQKSTEFSQLMQSIKNEGLINPITVLEAKNLNPEDFMTLNITENIHREDITPTELSRACRHLHEELGLTSEQISVRLSLPKSRIKNIMDLGTNKAINKELKEYSFVGQRKQRKGKLPFVILNAINSWRISNNLKDKVVKLAKDEEMSLNQISVVGLLIRGGMTPEKAVSNFRKYKFITPLLVMNLEKYNQLVAGHKKREVSKTITAMLVGKEKLIPELFYYKK